MITNMKGITDAKNSKYPSNLAVHFFVFFIGASVPVFLGLFGIISPFLAYYLLVKVKRGLV
jgi:hypothetical protein